MTWQILKKLTDAETRRGFKAWDIACSWCDKRYWNLQFNTAIAKMMEFINDFTSLPAYPKSVVKMAPKS